MAKSKAMELLAALDAATEDDLKEMDAEIATVEARLDGLKSARKLVATRLGIVPEKPAKAPKPPKATRSAPGGGPSVAQQVLKHIAKNGPERVNGLAAALKIQYATIYSAVNANPEWFDVQSNGVHLTTAGQQAAKE